jgi:hypothetical protein
MPVRRVRSIACVQSNPTAAYSLSEQCRCRDRSVPWPRRNRSGSHFRLTFQL